MKNFVLPKDYPELDFQTMVIFLIENGDRLLGGMSEKSSAKALRYLEKLGITVVLNKLVKDFNGDTVFLSDGTTLKSHTLIWAAGIKGNSHRWTERTYHYPWKPFAVDRYNRVEGYRNIFAIGDLAYMTEEKYPNGHPQVAQVAIQQAKCLARQFEAVGKKHGNESFYLP